MVEPFPVIIKWKGENMKQWTEKEFLSNTHWYHATSAKFFEKIMEKGVLADVNRNSELDFGWGFYLTANSKWAEKYAMGFENERIIEFCFKPRDLLGDSKNYRFFGKLDKDFAEFVFSNRMYFEKSPNYCVHNYELVGGVMSDGTQVTDFEEFRNREITKDELFRRLLLPREDWQLLLHSQELCNQIKPSRAYDLKGGVYDVSKYHKTI